MRNNIIKETFPSFVEISPESNSISVFLKGEFQYNIENIIQLNNLKLWAVKNKKTNDLTFHYKHYKLTVNKNGNLSNWPVGFLSGEMDSIILLIKLRKDIKSKINNDNLCYINEY